MQYLYKVDIKYKRMDRHAKEAVFTKKVDHTVVYMVHHKSLWHHVSSGTCQS